MKKIVILVPRGEAVVSCIEGTMNGFQRANDILMGSGKQRMFDIRLVGIDHQPQKYGQLFTVTPDLTIEDDYGADLIVIPAINGNWTEVIAQNQPFIDWIRTQHSKGAEVASLCVGAFLLAATGLLDGGKCATHWIAQNDFRRMFPDVEVVADGIITDESGLYTSGGAISFWNLILYLIDKYAGREVAIICAKIYEVEIDRYTQSPFIIFSGQRDHEDSPIRKAQAYIETNFNSKITVEELATMCAMGRRTFERRFKKATSNTVVEYLQRVKIEAAKRSLEHAARNISEVMYEVGYTDNKAFRTTFKKITGLSPIDYRNKYAVRRPLIGDSIGF